MLAFLEQQVLRLQVPMAHAELVQVLHTFQDLVEEFGCVDVVYAIVAHDVVEELACVRMLHNQVQFALCFNYLIKLDDARVPNFLEDFDFASNSIDVGLVLDLVLLQYLDGHLLLRYCVDAQLDLSEGALAERLVYQEMRYLTQFTLLLLFCSGRA